MTVGRWLVVNHKHDDYASTALTLVNVTNTTRLLGGDTEKEMHVFVYMFFKRKNTRASSFYRCFTILRLRKWGIICAHFHVLEKKGEAR